MSQRRLWADAISYADIAELFTADDVWLSRRDIAEQLGVSKSNGLSAKIEQLVADGVLRRQETALINRATVYLYARVSHV